jgi:hypothetical protein
VITSWVMPITGCVSALKPVGLSHVACSPCGLWFADNGHINVGCRPGDVHPLALSDRGPRVTRRNIDDPTIIGRRAIALAFGGEGGAAKAKHKRGDEKKLSHLATLLCGRELNNSNWSDVFLPSVGGASCRIKAGDNFHPVQCDTVCPTVARTLSTEMAPQPFNVDRSPSADPADRLACDPYR